MLLRLANNFDSTTRYEIFKNILFHLLQFAIGSLMDDYLGKSHLSFIFVNSTEFLFKCSLVVVAGLVS